MFIRILPTVVFSITETVMRNSPQGGLHSVQTERGPSISEFFITYPDKCFLFSDIKVCSVCYSQAF